MVEVANDFLVDNQVRVRILGDVAVVLWLSVLHNFTQISLNSGSAQVQTLLATCRTLVPAENKAKSLSSVNHTTNTIQNNSLSEERATFLVANEKKKKNNEKMV